MSQNPPASLLRLREADVVRLCGLGAAARGLELVAQRAVRRGRRVGARLEAGVEDDGSVAVWWEQAAEQQPGPPRWGCERDAPDRDTPGDPISSPASPTPTLCCAHVAALLTAWIRSPADFPAPQTEEPESGDRVVVRQRHRLTQPMLVDSPSHRTVSPADPSLAAALARLSAADLAALARRVLGTEPDEPTAHAALAATLADPDRLAAVVAKLDPAPRTLLAWVALAGGAITAGDLDAMAERAGEAPSALRARAQVLERHGLLFPAPGTAAVQRVPTSERTWRDVAGWRIPSEVSAALAVELPLDALLSRPPDGLPLLSADVSARPRAARPLPASPAALCLALALLAHAPAPYNPLLARPAERAAPPSERAASVVVVPGDLPGGALATLARSVGMPPGLLAMARRLLLWGRDAGTPLDPVSAPPAVWPALLRAAFHGWREAEAPFELADLSLTTPLRLAYDPAHPALRPAAVAAEARDARRFLLRVIAAARPGAWYRLDDLLELLWRVDPLFLRGRQRAYETPAWWLERGGSRRPLRPTVREEWLAGEGEYARALIAGPLHWWGLLDLAAEPPHGDTVAFRLTPFGAALLSSDAGDLPLAGLDRRDWGPAAVVTREGELALQPLAAGAPLLHAVERWMRPARLVAGRLIYAADPERIAAALDAGDSPDTLVSRLRAVPGGARVADVVGRLLDARRATYGASRLYSGWTLVEGRDGATLEEALAAAPEVRERAVRLAPHLALVAPADAGALEALLRRRGYTV